MLLHHLAQQQPHDHGGEKANDDIERKALRLGVGAQAGDRVLDALHVDQNDSEDGAGLDGDLEDFGLLSPGRATKVHQRVGQNQVAGAGDGQKLCQALHDAHHGGFQKQHNVHGQRPCRAQSRPILAVSACAHLRTWP